MTAEKNAELTRELNVYRSVNQSTTATDPTIPASLGLSSNNSSLGSSSTHAPPMTHLTRVGRQPLAVRSLNEVSAEALDYRKPTTAYKTATERMTMADLNG